MQPILTSNAPATLSGGAGARPRRGGVISYVDPGSGDDIPDAGEVDSDGSDFVASGGTRSAVRSGTPGPAPREREREGGKAELDQSYLGMIPPAKFITARPAFLTKYDDLCVPFFTKSIGFRRLTIDNAVQYVSPYESLEEQAQRTTSLVPIRVEFETDTHRIRDCFVWNLHEALVTPEQFARTFCTDLDLPHNPWAETVANQIRAQLEDHEAVGGMELAVDGADVGDEVPECRVVLSIDVQVDNHHLLDHIEWDLRSTLTPEAFTHQLCLDLGLSGEAHPLIAHAIHEELIRHKRDAVEWGVISGAEREREQREREQVEEGGVRDKSGLSLLKDKTGFGIGVGEDGRKEGRGPRVLRSVWRDWAEAEEFGTRWEVLSAEEVERREVERERASRRLRRETSKFQSSTRTRRR
ncbi:hypothetical protein EW146_g1107 [Bondarzewia mesenterica]|uniref:SNF5-domain-containing protein n=1 Tax=Bondarzewia mesenterica TaxID=1095465 RepID=A0A4V3XG63_9AGAM|nr:hypothetical protein EW146_g1107 [Bondarzewia mesenterica]